MLTLGHRQWPSLGRWPMCRKQAVKNGQPMSNVNAGKGFENRTTNTDWVYFKHAVVVLLGHDAKSISRPNGLNSLVNRSVE